MTDQDIDEEFIDEDTEIEDSESDDESESSSDGRRSWILLLIVLAIGAILLGFFLAMRPAPIPLPPMKPPWLV